MLAEEKLEEAKYFLDKLVGSTENERHVKFNVSAFLSAARSVTLYLQKEFHDNPNFQSWYISKQKEMKRDSLLEFFKEKRNFVLKEEYGKFRQHLGATIPENIHVAESVLVKLVRANGTTEEIKAEPQPPPQEQKDKDEATLSHKWFLEDYPDVDVITLCQEYIDKLSSLIEEAKVIIA